MSVTEAPAPPRRSSFSDWMRNQLRNIAPFATLLVLVILFSLASPSFFTFDNLQNILQQISVTGIMAVGLTFVILCAEIDLSVASIANAVGIVVAFFTLQDSTVNIANIPLPGGFAIILALIASVLMGAANAFGMTVIGIPSFIMTLAMLQIVKSLRTQGIGVVVVSTEPETVLSLADRILVMKRGRIAREFAGEVVSKDRLLAAA